MFRVDKPKAALQPAQNKVNVKDDTRQLHHGHAELNDPILSLKQQLSVPEHQRANQALIKDKLGDVIGKIQLHSKQLSENEDYCKPIILNNDGKLKQQSPKEPSPPRLRQHVRTTRASTKLMQLNQQQISANQKQGNQHELSDKRHRKAIVPSTFEKQRDIKHKSSSEPAQQQQLKSSTILSGALSEVVSRIPRLPRAPAHSNLLQFIQQKSSDDNDKEKQMEITDDDEDVQEEIIDIDKLNSTDALFHCCDYVKDIYEYLHQIERDQSIAINSLEDQKIYTPKIRQKIINWCIDIHDDLNLLPETLYMTVATIDRFFQSFNVTSINQVQLVALGAMMIASKYEEIYPPSVDDFVYKSQGSYTKREIFKVEITILKTLRFDLGRPIPLSFLRRFSRAARFDMRMHSIAKYLMELSLSEYECSHWRPSLLAATAVFIVIQLTGTNSSKSRLIDMTWSRTMAHYTTYEKKQILAPAAILCKILKKSQRLPSAFSCSKKYTNSLVKWPELKSAKVDQLIKCCEK